MIVARAYTDSGSQIFIIGLSAENIRRLQADQPITMTPETHHLPPGWSIFLMYGETEMSLAKQLEALGMVGPGTVVKIDPRLGS